jgi:DNA-binding NarL/FixJ family response regulator
VPDLGSAAERTLTPREREVLEHAALGKSNRQIGEALDIAEQTVKNHLNNAMRKLSLHDRTHAVVFAIGSGLISLPLPSDGSRASSHSDLGERVSEPATD